MTSIRPLTPEDYDAVRRLLTESLPERAEDCESAWTEARGRHFVAKESANDPVIGYGFVWPQNRNRHRIDLVVDPTYRRRGVGSDILARLKDEIENEGGFAMQARAVDSNSEALSFLTRHGFVETNRMTRLRLDLAGADLSPSEVTVQEVAKDGIVITTLAAEGLTLETCDPALIPLMCACQDGRSDPYLPPGTAVSVEKTSEADAKQILSGYHPLSPEAFFLAKHGTDYVGLSFLDEKLVGGGDVFQGDTAVHSAWRRRGIATALKVRVIAYARERGFTAIRTHTASAGMLAINLKMGFVSRGAEVRMVKALEAPGSVYARAAE